MEGMKYFCIILKVLKECLYLSRCCLECHHIDEKIERVNCSDEDDNDTDQASKNSLKAIVSIVCKADSSRVEIRILEC
jgi:hypothetical protein